MKRTAAVATVLLAFLVGGNAHALGPLGTLPPEPEDVGSMSLSGGYVYRELRLVPRKHDFSAFSARQNHFYVQAADGAYGWEWAGRLGMADFDDGQQFNPGYRPFAGLGLKGYVYGDRGADFSVTSSFRADMYSRYKVADVGVAPGLQANVRVKGLWDAEAGLMAQQRFGRMTVYGGPVYEYVEADVYRTATVPVGVELAEDSYYKKQANLGVAGGVSWVRGTRRFVFETAFSSGSYSLAFEAAVGF